MTKYLLEGGNYLSYPDKARAFFAEALRDLGEKPTILWCFFASEVEERHERYLSYTKRVADESILPAGVVPNHIEATEGHFAEQVQAADLINIQGGSTKLLKATLEPFDLETMFAGKVVGCHSAGAHILVDSFWSPGLRQFGRGFKLLPYKILTHFNSDFGSDDPRGPIDWEAAKSALEAYGNQEHKTLLLSEGEFVTFER